VTTGQSDGVLGRPPVCNASGGNENVGVNGLVVAAVKPVEPSQSKLTAPAGPMKLSAVRVEHPGVIPPWATAGNVWLKRSVVAVAMPAMIKIERKTNQTLRCLVVRARSSTR